MVFETLSGGHFGEDAIFLCHVMLFPHVTLATLSRQSTALPHTPCPSSLALQSWALGLNNWKRSGGWGGVPAIVHSKNLWALKANFLLKFLYSLKLFY